MKLITIEVNNNYAKINGASKEVELEIFTKLSYFIEEFNAEYSKRRHLFNRKTKKTYTGLLCYVEEILNNLQEEYQIIDTREKHAPNADFKLDKSTFEIRDYQMEIIDNCQPREIIQAATGAGKTLIMAGIIAKFNVKPVCVFADKLSLCIQMRDEFQKFLNTKVGLVGGGVNQKEDITIYSVQSATEEDVSDAKLIMYDECFDADTLITLEDGKTKVSIEDVYAHDWIGLKALSYNLETNELEPNRIENCIAKPRVEPMVDVSYLNSSGKVETLRCTNSHKIWVSNKNLYVEASSLTTDDEIIII